MTDNQEDTPAIIILKDQLDRATRRAKETEEAMADMNLEGARLKKTSENASLVIESLKMSIRDLQELRGPMNTAQETK